MNKILIVFFLFSNYKLYFNFNIGKILKKFLFNFCFEIIYYTRVE